MTSTAESELQFCEGSVSASKLGNQSPSVDFIDNRLHQYHEAFANPPTKFDAPRGQYVPATRNTVQPSLANLQRPRMASIESMKFWKDIFAPAMKSFKKQYPIEPNGRVESGYSIRDSTSWSGVWEKLTQAQESYDGPEGMKGTVRKGLRRFVDGSQRLNGTVALVPDSEFTTPIISVIKALLVAAKTTTDLRNAVTGGLEELEQHFGDIEDYVKMFPNDKNIKTSSTNMVVSILKAIEDVIGYYTRNRTKKAFSIIFNGDEYRETLTSSLSNVTTSSKALLHQADNSNMWQTCEVLEETTRNSARLEQILEGQNAIKGLLEQYELNRIHWKRERAILLARIAQYEQYPYANSSSETLQTAKPTMPDLPGLVGISDSGSLDMEHILQIRELIPPSHRETADALATMPKFGEWIAAPISKKILIHGEFEGTHYVSAVSLFCSSLYRTLESTGRYIALVFFCGRHLGNQGGGRFMIQSLTAQLLGQHQFDTSDLESHVNLALIHSGDVEQLLILFQYLVRQLSDHTVFCIIDGIKYYERDHFLSEMSYVLRALLDLTEDANMGSIFKILVASPSPTTIVRQAFSPGEIVSLAPNSGSGQGPSTLRLARNLQAGLEASKV